MITENKSALPADRISKYLLYAFGEIVLVVIGILIALQVSNWNENRKNRIFEKTMLRNIQEDIIQDTLDLGFNIEVYKKALQNEKLLLRLLNKDSTITVDSINFVEALSVPLIAVVHKSSFNNLIYNNPNLISNKELKKKIERHYDFFYTALLELENKQSDYHLYDKLLPYFKKHFKISEQTVNLIQKAGESKEYFNEEYERSSMELIDIISIQNDNEFAIDLSEIIFLRSVVLSFYDEAIVRTKDLYKEIDDELKK